MRSGLLYSWYFFLIGFTSKTHYPDLTPFQLMADCLILQMAPR